MGWLKNTGDFFWDEQVSSLSEIDVDKTLIIGDFGLGADATFALESVLKGIYK